MKVGNFKGNYLGLSIEEVKNSKKINGLNVLGDIKKESLFIKLINIFKEPMFLLLLGLSFTYILLGEYFDSIIMFVFIMFIAIISFYQEYKTDKALDELKKLSSSKNKVIRDSKLIEISSEDLVVGDILFLQEGNVINADGDILECRDFGVNESTLTGESAIVWKKIKLNINEEKEYFKKNKCYSGTTVTGGEAVLIVTQVGLNTEHGKIGNALKNIQEPQTLLEKQTRKLIKIWAFVSIIFMFLVFVISFINNIENSTSLFNRIADSIIAGITIAMATIPEELPVILTVFLTMGSYLISKQKSLVRKTSVIETLGSISVICVDKTGTITENKMTVVDSYNHDTFEKLVNASFLSCENEAYDPMEQAIISFCKEKMTSKLKNNNPFYEYSFSSESKIMAHVYKNNNSYIAYAKGAYEKIISLCELSDDEKEKIKEINKSFTNKGYRVIAVASTNFKRIKKNLYDYKLSFLGLLAISDPPRYGVKEAIENCYDAGIKVVMITGDNGETAKAICNEIGLKDSDKIITGEELEQMNDKELDEIVKEVTIFARVYPNHKMRIVNALQKNNMIVAMTGDGVNDATALKKADVGISMGKRGTEVAKESSKLVLLDDNFKTIVVAIKNGRRVYENIRKAIGYVLIIHIPIALAAVIIPLFNLPILLFPIHIVLLELIIDPTASIVFERCQADKDIMKKNPRNINEKLLNYKNIITYIIQGLIISISFIGSYIYMIKNGYSQELALTFSISTLILSNLFIVFVNSSKDLSINNFISTLKDKVILRVVLGIVLLLFIIIYVPFFQKIVGTTPLSIYQLLLTIIVAVISTIWYDLIKIINKNKL